MKWILVYLLFSGDGVMIGDMKEIETLEECIAKAESINKEEVSIRAMCGTCVAVEVTPTRVANPSVCNDPDVVCV